MIRRDYLDRLIEELTAIGVGIISLVVLAIAIYARYSKQMTGAWRWIYIVTAVTAFYLNFFVL